MAEFFYRIKSYDQRPDSWGNSWSYRPILNGFIEADSKAHARELLEAELKVPLPMRVKKADAGVKYPFFIAIYPSDPENYYTKELKKKRTCQNEECGVVFTKMEKEITDDYGYNGGADFCTAKCAEIHRLKHATEWAIENGGTGVPVIYRISNKKTGKCYIGQTTQPFTLRWWQHLHHNASEKFGNAMNEADITDWTFEVVEVVKDHRDLTARELFHIQKENCIENGYNTTPPQKIVS